MGSIAKFMTLIVALSFAAPAIAQSGDYIGRIEVNSKAANTALDVVINTLVP